MRDNESGAAKGRRRGRFVHGDRVRIASGKLEGLMGVVTRLSSRFDYALAVEGWPDGAYLLVIGDGIELVKRESITAPKASTRPAK